MSLTPEDLEQIPRRYRWLIRLFQKIPNPRVPFFLADRLPEIEGLYWAVIVPIFLVLLFYLIVYLVPFLSLHFAFPFNVLIDFLILLPVPLIFLRVQFERAVLLWKSYKSSQIEWNVTKVVEELFELRRKQKRETKK
jgi:ABC-type transport system involved in cytochrome bd biosynthesis fused ATPase/permease subunit